MPKLTYGAALFPCAALALVAGSASAQTNEAGELSYINCEAGFGVIFPRAPMMRDVRYTTNTGAMVPARQFYLEEGGKRLMVTVARFGSGPLIDEAAMKHAADTLKARGELRYEAAGAYDPGFPGIQLNIFPNANQQLRASVYMMEHKLYIIEALAPPSDVEALQFEQSITLVNEIGVDYDQNPPDPIHKLTCRPAQYFRR